MQLVVDASILVAELLRQRGRELVAHQQLDLSLATEAFNETEHELRKRVAQLQRHGHVRAGLAQRFMDDAVALLSTRVALAPAEVYTGRLDEAQWRIPRDPNDVPTVALALTLGRGIWTTDYDFFGCGLPTWTTDTLLRYLDSREEHSISPGTQ